MHGRSAEHSWLNSTQLAVAMERPRPDAQGMVIRCRARTKEGRLCKRKVSSEGMRCPHHKGLSAAGPRDARTKRPSKSAKDRSPQSGPRKRTSPPNSRTGNGVRAKYAKEPKRQQQHVKQVAKVCNEVLADGWEKTVENRVSDYATKRIWDGLFRRRHRGTCKNLDRLAADILAGKKAIHSAIGRFAQWILSTLGRSKFEQALFRELGNNIPLPMDKKAIAVARGVQVTGIALCIAEGSDLTRCPCFIDLALEETKDRVKQILAAARGDWKRLAEFPPPEHIAVVT